MNILLLDVSDNFFSLLPHLLKLWFTTELKFSCYHSNVTNCQLESSMFVLHKVGLVISLKNPTDVVDETPFLLTQIILAFFCGTLNLAWAIYCHGVNIGIIDGGDI